MTAFCIPNSEPSLEGNNKKGKVCGMFGPNRTLDICWFYASFLQIESWSSEKLHCLLVQGLPGDCSGTSLKSSYPDFQSLVPCCESLVFFYQLQICRGDAQRILGRTHFFCYHTECFQILKESHLASKALFNRIFHVIGLCSTKTKKFKGCFLGW